MTRIAILDDYQQAALTFAPWRSLPKEIEVVTFSDHVHEPDALTSRLKHFDVIVAMRERTAFPRQVLERLPDLRLLVTTGYRNAAIDLAAANDCAILVSGTGGYLPATPELTWGLILASLRNIAEEHASIRAGGWQHTMGADLSGATLGVIGLGNMGKLVAKVGLAFDMNVIGWSQNISSLVCAEIGVQQVSKEVLFRTSDVVSIHLQMLGQRNRGLIGRDDFALMKTSAILVNTSRGPIVDENALIEALQSGQIGGAAIDVFDQEPLPRDHPFRTLPRLLTTPHIGYVTRNTYAVFFEQVVEDIQAYLVGTPIRLLSND